MLRKNERMRKKMYLMFKVLRAQIFVSMRTFSFEFFFFCFGLVFFLLNFSYRCEMFTLCFSEETESPPTCVSQIVPLVSHLCRWTSHSGNETLFVLWMFLYKCKSGFIPTLTPASALFASYKRSPLSDPSLRPPAMILESDMLPKSFFLLPEMLSIEATACGRPCFVAALSAVVGCLWGV